MTRWLETDSLSNQNIASGLAIGAYTADADRLILCQFFADQVAGNGDYDFWLTHQIAGSGSSYRYVPKTTATVASGVTAIAGQSIMVAVRSGDVLTAYLDGLAGDTTTPDTTVRWFELAALRPATADRTLAVDASGLVDLVDAPNATAVAAIQSGLATPTNITAGTITTVTTVTNGVTLADDAITASKYDESTAFPLKAADAGSTYVARTGADSDTLETLSDQLDGVGGATGSGAISFPVTVNDEGGDPIDGVEVWISTDSAGASVVAGTLSTDALGLATFMLDAGTYYLWRQKSGYNFTNPVTITVS